MRSLIGPPLLGVYAGGSWALGDYVAGESDLDVAVVIDAPLGDQAAEALVAAVRHETMACPARALELVVYTAETAAAGGIDAGFQLNLNTGERMATRIERDGQTGEPYWYPIDRAILAERGVSLFGPPAAAAFASAPRMQLLAVLRDSLDHWDPGRPHDEVLNRCREAYFETHGRWASKTDAGRWALTQPGASEAIAAALAARQP